MPIGGPLRPSERAATLRRSVRLFRAFRRRADRPGPLLRAARGRLGAPASGYVRRPGPDGSGARRRRRPRLVRRGVPARPGATYVDRRGRRGRARRRAAAAGAGRRARRRRCRCRSRDGAVDVCYSSNVLEHVPEPWAMADEMLRVTRPGGTRRTCRFTNWLSPWGGHETSPWHYSGGARAARRYARRTRPAAEERLRRVAVRRLGPRRRCAGPAPSRTRGGRAGGGVPAVPPVVGARAVAGAGAARGRHLEPGARPAAAVTPRRAPGRARRGPTTPAPPQPAAIPRCRRLRAGRRRRADVALAFHQESGRHHVRHQARPRRWTRVALPRPRVSAVGAARRASASCRTRRTATCSRWARSSLPADARRVAGLGRPAAVVAAAARRRVHRHGPPAARARHRHARSPARSPAFAYALSPRMHHRPRRRSPSEALPMRAAPVGARAAGPRRSRPASPRARGRCCSGLAVAAHRRRQRDRRRSPSCRCRRCGC